MVQCPNIDSRIGSPDVFIVLILIQEWAHLMAQCPNIHSGNGLTGWFSVLILIPELAHLIRDCHGYGFTRGISKTGIAGAGRVVDFDTPWHTAYPYHSIVGMHR